MTFISLASGFWPHLGTFRHRNALPLMHSLVYVTNVRMFGCCVQAEGGSAAAEAQLLLLRPWCELVGLLTQHLQVLKEACVPRILTKCLFKQVWYTR